MPIIYMARNKVNQHIYIGKSTQSLRTRISKHMSAAQRNPTTYFHKALAHYVGSKAEFEWSVIEETTIENLDSREIYWIQFFKDQGYRLYNLTIGGEGGMHGRTHSEETKAKMSQVRKGVVFSDETKQRMSESAKNRPQKSYRLRSPEGLIVEIVNMREFCRQNGYSAGVMIELTKGKRKSAYGWSKA